MNTTVTIGIESNDVDTDRSNVAAYNGKLHVRITSGLTLLGDPDDIVTLLHNLATLAQDASDYVADGNMAHALFSELPAPEVV